MNKFKSIFLFFWEFHKPFSSKIFVAFLLLVFGQIAFLSLPYIQGKIVDGLISDVSTKTLILWLVILFLNYSIVTLITAIREVWEWKELYFKIQRHVSVSTIKKLFLYSIGQHTNEHSGLRQSTISQGESAIQDFSENFTYNVIPMFLQIILTCIFLTIVNPILGIVCVLASAIYLYVSFKSNLRYYPELKKNYDNWQKLGKNKSELIRYLSLIKIESQEDFSAKKYEDLNKEIAHNAERIWINVTKSSNLHTLLIQTMQVATIGLAVLLVKFGMSTPGIVVTIIGWIGNVFGNVGSIGWMQRQAMRQVAQIEKYFEIFKLEPAIVENPDAIELGNINGKIEFKDVSFRYPKVKRELDEDSDDINESEEVSNEILKEVSFTINAGETAALVGHSGAGKTTIIQLLLRGYDPESGCITIDDIDIKKLKIKSYLSRIGYVEQNVRLFDGTLKENILFGTDEKSVTSHELDEISKKTRIDQFFDRLGTEKYGALLGENGIWLSGGERQRVGIARALIKKPQILIFDEATSSLDSLNESLIHEAMKEALRGKTGIIIAHRLSTIKDVDKIIVMDKGKIVGTGRHGELLKTCPQYKSLVKNQLLV